jgi:anti-anti-sigma factor
MQLTDLSDSACMVALSGRLDSESVARLEVGFTASLSGASKDAIIDLTRVDFCGSLAIRMLLGAARIVQRRQHRIILAGAQPQVQEVFDTVALSTIIPLAPTQEEARRMLGA